MAGRNDALSTYDRMLAEIDLADSDEREKDVVVPFRKVDVSAFAVPQRAEGKRSTRTVVEVKPKKNSDDEENEHKGRDLVKAEPQDKAGEHRATDGASGSQQRYSSYPPAPRKTSSRRSSKSQKSEHEDSDDDSDQDKEARIRYREYDDGFGASSALTRVCGADHREETAALRSFLTRAPRAGSPAVRCYIQRDRSGLNRLHPIYRLFLEADKQFLLCAQKRTSSKTSNYLLTMEKSPTDRRSPQVVAKLRANWSGSEYTVFDDGLCPNKTALDSSTRNILGFIEFAYDDSGPGRLNVRIPFVQETGAAQTWKDPGEDTEKQRAQEKTALMLRNKRPTFDSKCGGYVLDFKGRVTMPSIKNFQMQSDAHGDDTVLQFGRVSCQPPGPRVQCKCHKDHFIMDLRHPLAPVQAFAICLAVLDSKVADGKIFDSVTKVLKRVSA